MLQDRLWSTTVSTVHLYCTVSLTDELIFMLYLLVAVVLGYGLVPNKLEPVK